MSSAVEPDSRRAQQVNSARKKLKQFRASRTSHTTSPSHTSRASSTSSGSGSVLNNSTAENTNTFPRRVPSSNAKAVLDAVADAEAAVRMDTMSRHARQASRHQRQRSSVTLSWPPQHGQSSTPRPTVVGLFDVPPLDHYDEATKVSDAEQSDTSLLPHEVVTTPATPPFEKPPSLPTDNEGAAVARLNAFSFGAKPSSSKPSLLPSFPIREKGSGRPPSVRLSKSALDFASETSLRDSLSTPLSNSRPNSPQPSAPPRRRHSHNRSESISLPNLKLGRPASLGLPSPGFPSTPSSPMGDVNSRSRFSTPQSGTPQSGSRLKFEPSDKEKEESRRRALDKLTGGGGTPKAREREEPKPAEIALPVFDDDDDLSTTSSRPPSDALTSTASSSRPSSFTFGSSSSFNSLSASPLSWSQFEENERWSFGQSLGQSFGQRFDPKEDAPVFGLEMSGPAKTSSVLINTSSLGVLTEEDETESDADDEAAEMTSTTSSVADPQDTPESTPAGPTPSRLRELHLVSSVSTQGSGRRSSNPDVARSLAQARETPTKGYGTIGRGRPRPLALDNTTASVFKNASATPSPSKGPRPSSLNLGRRPPGTRGSSISYKKDDSGSGSSHDYASSRGITSPPTVVGEVIGSPPSVTSPLAEWTSSARPLSRPCPRPRSAILGGTSGRVLGEVDEEEEEANQWRSYDARDDGISTGRASTEASRDSYDWSRRDSRDRIDAEMERDALREDVDLWRKRCRGLEERLEAERREATVLRERVRKLGDRLLTVSAASSAMSPAKEREAAQSRLINEMRDQLFSLTSALERERKEKNEALSHLAELQAANDGARTPLVTPNSLPTTPKSRPRLSSTGNMFGTPPEARYADANFLDAVEDDEEAIPAPGDDDTNWRRMRGFAFPQGAVEKSDRENKRESFFGLSRPRPVRPAPSIGGGLGLDWATSPTGMGFDLPPIEVNDNNRDLIRPASFILNAKRASRTLREREVAREREREGLPEQDVERSPPISTVDLTPERQTAGASSFGLSFLSGYLPLPRTTPPVIPRVLVTPSSVSPKKTPRVLERELMTHHVARAGDIDMRHSCRRCTGEVIEL